MKLLRGIGLTVVLLIAGFWLWYQLIQHHYSWSQKLTVTVQTPEGERSGSGITWTKVTNFDPCPSFNLGFCGKSEQRGSAVVVALPEDRYLFVLIEQVSHQFALDVFGPVMRPDNHGRFTSIPDFYDEVRKGLPRTTVPPDEYPLFVTFGDVDDPASVKKVDPADLSATFGPGYALTSATLEITNKPVDFTAVESVLPWLQSYRENHFRLDGKDCTLCPVSDEDLAAFLSTSQFIWRE